MISIKRKEWDSEFFGYEVYEVRQEPFSETELMIEFDKMRKKNIRLIYYISKEKHHLSDGVNPADEKVLYAKKLANAKKDELYIRSYADNEDYKKLLPLSFLSGKYSRFRLDQNFVKKEFERLFEEWIKRSVDRSIADEVLVYDEENEIKGMVTVSFKEKIAQIGLISVADGQQGKNIGSKLLEATENQALKNNCTVLHVYTQKKNLPACNFYEKNGYSVSGIDYIYHFWLQS